MMKAKITGDLSWMVIFWDAVSEKVAPVVSDGRKTRENMLGLSYWSMVEVRLKITWGGKWTWKICWVCSGLSEAGVAAIANAESRAGRRQRVLRPERYFCE